jgi:hypothetical protein
MSIVLLNSSTIYNAGSTAPNGIWGTNTYGTLGTNAAVCWYSGFQNYGATPDGINNTTAQQLFVYTYTSPSVSTCNIYAGFDGTGWFYLNGVSTPIAINGWNNTYSYTTVNLNAGANIFYFFVTNGNYGSANPSGFNCLVTSSNNTSLFFTNSTFTGWTVYLENQFYFNTNTMTGYEIQNLDIAKTYQASYQVIKLINSATTSAAYTLAASANSTSATADNTISTANNTIATANNTIATANSRSTTANSTSTTATNTANSVITDVNNLPYVSNSGSNTFFTWYLYFNNFAINSASGTGTQRLYSKYTGNFGGYYILSTNSSSIKTKTNVYDITPEESAQIYKMRPVKFNFKDDLEKECIGFIAEEMFEVEPRVVPYNIVDGVKEPVSINYEHLVPLLVAEIKNLKKYIDELNIELNKKIDN